VPASWHGAEPGWRLGWLMRPKAVPGPQGHCWLVAGVGAPYPAYQYQLWPWAHGSAMAHISQSRLQPGSAPWQQGAQALRAGSSSVPRHTRVVAWLQLARCLVLGVPSTWHQGAGSGHPLWGCLTPPAPWCHGTGANPVPWHWLAGTGLHCA